MKSALRYFAWNVFLIGTLFAGWIAGVPKFSGIIVGIAYAIILPLYFLVFLVSAGDKSNKLAMAFKSWSLWKYLPEAIFISFTAYMGYKKISVCMFAELAMVTYLWITTKIKKSEEKDEENQEVK